MIGIAVSAGEDAAEENAIRAVLADFNAEQGWPHAPEALRVLLREAGGAILGGLIATANWRWLWVRNLAVPRALRGQGWGARLLARAEDEARALGCVGVRLDTYSFQARGFYERQGYALSGEIADCPPGHTRYTMTKRLDSPAPAAEPWPDAAAPRATIQITHAERDAAQSVIEAGLIAHNTPFAGPNDFLPLNIVLRRPGEARPAGGLIGFRLHRWLCVKELWLPEDLRGGGLGAAVLARAEREAAALGCIGVWLDTYSFQARPFYERLGYRVFGTLEDFPLGHARHYLMKRLEPAQGER